MTVFLSLEDVLEIHRQVIGTSGGMSGVRDVGLLDSAIHRPRAAFGGMPMYPDLAQQAAALLHSLAGNHPFVDGNKRTAFTAMDVFLRLNGARLEAYEDDKYDLMINAASGQLSFSDVAEWIAQHISPG